MQTAPTGNAIKIMSADRRARLTRTMRHGVSCQSDDYFGERFAGNIIIIIIIRRQRAAAQSPGNRPGMFHEVVRSRDCQERISVSVVRKMLTSPYINNPPQYSLSTGHSSALGILLLFKVVLFVETACNDEPGDGFVIGDSK